MKFTSAILALCAATQVAAFAPQASTPASTALFSSRMPAAPARGGQTSFNTPQARSPGVSPQQSQAMSQNTWSGAQAGQMTRQQNRGAAGLATSSQQNHIAKDVWETAMSQETVQGGSLRTWSFTTSAIERVGVFLKTEGRPLNALVELWNGPDYTPVKMNVYCEDGNLRPFSCVLETPRSQNAVAIRNTGQMEFPLDACMDADVEDGTGSGYQRLGNIIRDLANKSTPKRVQGGAIQTFPFSPQVQSVQVMLKTDGRPLNARLELLQGPNNNKQVVDIYSEDGMERPFFVVLETPGSGNVVRVINTATVEFPYDASVEPYVISQYGDEMRGGDSRNYFIVD